MQRQFREHPHREAGHFRRLDHLGDPVPVLLTDAFPAGFYRFFNGMLPLHHCAVFAFPGGEAPLPLVAEGGSPEITDVAKLLAQEYTSGAFENDPIVRRLRGYGLPQPLVACMPASAIKDSSYRRRFYDDPAISEELHIFAQVDGLDFYACLFRDHSQPAFSVPEIHKTEHYAGLAIRLLRRQMELRGITSRPPVTADLTALSVDKREQLLERVRAALAAEGHGLSPREADICAHIALGYTILGIALNLGISINTVATHRKRAYAKLGICSQNELFARYLDRAGG